VRKVSIFFGVLTVLLVVAWFYRWEEGPNQRKEGKIIKYQTDRWIQQTWTKIYEEDDEGFTTKEYPVLSESQFEKYKNKYIKSQEYQEKENEIEKLQIDNTRIMAETESDFNYYTQVANDIYSKTQSSKVNIYINGVIFCDGISEPEVEEQLNQVISSDVKENFNRYCRAFMDSLDLEGQMNELQDEADKKARELAKMNALEQRQKATLIWYGLIATTATFTFLFGIIDLRKRRKVTYVAEK
jgi:hypothetical protein